MYILLPDIDGGAYCPLAGIIFVNAGKMSNLLHIWRIYRIFATEILMKNNK